MRAEGSLASFLCPHSVSNRTEVDINTKAVADYDMSAEFEGRMDTLTTSVQLVHTVDVVLAHLCGLAKDQVGIVLRDNRFLAVFGEGSAS